MKGESVHKRVAKLERHRGGVCFMALMGEDNRPENVEKLKQKIIARGQKPYFLHMYFGGQAEKDSYENNGDKPDQFA